MGRPTSEAGTRQAVMQSTTSMRRGIRAYTLVELLTVIAITAVLLTIIILPIVQTFNLTRTAQAFADAQDNARRLMERISREIGNSAYVRDNSGLKGSINIAVPAGPGSVGPNPLVAVTLPYSKLDLWQPAQDGAGVPGAWVNPNTGKIDPTLQAPKGQVTFPAAPGLILVRYFVGLREPVVYSQGAGTYVNNPYNNPYRVWSKTAADGALLKSRGGGRDNLFQLYRAEVVPYVWRIDKFGTPNSQAMRPNLAYFDSDATDTQIVDFDDPNFFRPNGDDSVAAGANLPGGAANIAKNQRILNWLKHSTVQTELSRYDMVQPIFDKRSLAVVFDPIPGGYYAPRLNSLVSFRPSRVNEGAAEGQQVGRLGDETDNGAAIAPDVFRTQFGGWANTVIRTYPVFSRPSPSWTSTDPYLIGRAGPTTNFGIYGIDPTTMTDDLNQGVLLFDESAYEQAVTSGQYYPFSIGLASANAVSGWLSSPALIAFYGPNFIPYAPDPNLGRITASFSITQVGDSASALANNANAPVAACGVALTPTNDPGLGAGVFSDAQYASLNRRFNKVWNDYSTLRPDIHRFIDLRVTPQIDGAASPLDPTLSFGRARIVPGSEEVYGPDQRPGPNYGRTIRYTRTTIANPGPNEYRINYVDQVEPDYTNPGLGIPPAALVGFNPNVYSATNFVSAVYQPRYKAGYIQLNSDPNVPLPEDDPSTVAALDAQVKVFYRFQFTKAERKPGQPSGIGLQDSFAVEYDSRQLMQILVTVRNYPQSTLPNSQSVTLKAEAPVRNFLR